MRLVRGLAVALAVLIGGLPPVADAQQAKPGGLHIDVPVVLKDARIVFNMDHLVFADGLPTGLGYMRLMSRDFAASATKWQIIAIFHGPAGYMMLNDGAYDRVRKTTSGNPYKQLVAELQKIGVRFEECGQTARDNGWVNADLLPDVAVNSGANARIVQLVQDGFVQLQP